MKKIILAVLIFTCILFVSPLFAFNGYNRNGPKQIYKNHLPIHGDFYRNGQKYRKYLPEYGSKIIQRGNRQQIYKNHLPQYGDFYRNGQKYKNYIPVWGDKIKNRD